MSYIHAFPCLIDNLQRWYNCVKKKQKTKKILLLFCQLYFRMCTCDCVKHKPIKKILAELEIKKQKNKFEKKKKISPNRKKKENSHG